MGRHHHNDNNTENYSNNNSHHNRSHHHPTHHHSIRHHPTHHHPTHHHPTHHHPTHHHKQLDSHEKHLLAFLEDSGKHNHEHHHPHHPHDEHHHPHHPHNEHHPHHPHHAQELINSLTHPKVLKDKLEDALKKLHPLLDDFKHNFVSHFLNPSYDEHQNLYTHSENQIHAFTSELLEHKNKTHHNTDEINKYFLLYNKKIEHLKRENNKLRAKYNRFNQTALTSNERMDEYQTIYQEQYMSNCSMFISLIIGGVIMSVVFKPSASQ